jgi:hypothetical protein
MAKPPSLQCWEEELPWAYGEVDLPDPSEKMSNTGVPLLSLCHKMWYCLGPAGASNTSPAEDLLRSCQPYLGWISSFIDADLKCG